MFNEWFVFIFFGALVCLVGWWTWWQAQIARRQAEAEKELAELGREVGAISHDLQNLFAVITANVDNAGTVPEAELGRVLGDVKLATASADKMLGAMRTRARTGKEQEGSIDGLLRLTVALLRRDGVRVDFVQGGELRYFGSESHAARLLQNLMVNAAEEARLAGGVVSVEVTGRDLRVTNRVRDPSLLGDDIYTRGVSHRGSTGVGLANARGCAERIGWTLRHEVHGSEVTFITGPRPDARA